MEESKDNEAGRKQARDRENNGREEKEKQIDRKKRQTPTGETRGLLFSFDSAQFFREVIVLSFLLCLLLRAGFI